MSTWLREGTSVALISYVKQTHVMQNVHVHHATYLSHTGRACMVHCSKICAAYACLLQDVNGCEQCACAECADISCMNYCPHGYQLDSNDCQVYIVRASEPFDSRHRVFNFIASLCKLIYEYSCSDACLLTTRRVSVTRSRHRVARAAAP